MIDSGLCMWPGCPEEGKWSGYCERHYWKREADRLQALLSAIIYHGDDYEKTLRDAEVLNKEYRERNEELSNKLNNARMALKEISNALECDQVCSNEIEKCDACGHQRGYFCAGCVARRGLSKSV